MSWEFILNSFHHIIFTLLLFEGDRQRVNDIPEVHLFEEPPFSNNKRPSLGPGRPLSVPFLICTSGFSQSSWLDWDRVNLRDFWLILIEFCTNWVRFSQFQAVSKYVSRLGRAADWSGERKMRLYHFTSAFNSHFKGFPTFALLKCSCFILLHYNRVM